MDSTTGASLHRSGGSAPERWRLPTGDWLPGFCPLPGGALLMAQSSKVGVEVWRISPKPNLPVSAFLSPSREML